MGSQIDYENVVTSYSSTEKYLEPSYVNSNLTQAMNNDFLRNEDSKTHNVQYKIHPKPDSTSPFRLDNSFVKNAGKINDNSNLSATKTIFDIKRVFRIIASDECSVPNINQSVPPNQKKRSSDSELSNPVENVAHFSDRSAEAFDEDDIETPAETSPKSEYDTDLKILKNVYASENVITR